MQSSSKRRSGRRVARARRGSASARKPLLKLNLTMTTGQTSDYTEGTAPMGSASRQPQGRFEVMSKVK